MGRKSEYDPVYAEQVKHLCKLGATDLDIAAFFGVSDRTINRWKKEYPEFCQSIKESKDLANSRVERSLFERATGYSHPAVKFMQYEGDVIEAEYVEHYPPDTAAAFIWLKNRDPERWRDKQEHELSGKDGAAITPVINIFTKK